MAVIFANKQHRTHTDSGLLCTLYYEIWPLPDKLGSPDASIALAWLINPLIAIYPLSLLNNHIKVSNAARFVFIEMSQ